jgi:hypothetical protein
LTYGQARFRRRCHDAEPWKPNSPPPSVCNVEEHLGDEGAISTSVADNGQHCCHVSRGVVAAPAAGRVQIRSILPVSDTREWLRHRPAGFNNHFVPRPGVSLQAAAVRGSPAIWALGEERIILASANELSPRSVSHFSDQGTSPLSLACRACERLGGLRSLANTSYRLRFPSFGRMLTNQTGVAGSDKRPRSKARHDSTDLPSRGSLPALRH